MTHAVCVERGTEDERTKEEENDILRGEVPF